MVNGLLPWYTYAPSLIGTSTLGAPGRVTVTFLVPSLRIVEELDYGEVATRMAVSEQAARARVSRGLKALTARLPAVEDLR